jgi:hypothetical protein
MTSGDKKQELQATESTWTRLHLSREDLDALLTLKDKWRTNRSKWWGQAADDDEQIGGAVIGVRPLRGGDTEVKIYDAIGAIELPQSVIIVHPKIPIAHFNYIAARSLNVPRIYKGNFGLLAGENFLELICLWGLQSIEEILRNGLTRNYLSLREDLKSVRGRVGMARTFINLTRGDLAIDCTHEEYSPDNPLNRVLKYSLQFMVGNAAISASTRGHAKRLLKQFGEVGNLQPKDKYIDPARNAKRYKDALHFANQIVEKRGLALESGQAKARSFLYKTPLLIEEGIRRIIAENLAPTRVIKPKAATFNSSRDKRISVNPDLAVSENPLYVGDVKYKVQTADWRRSDLAQSVFFAVAFNSPKSLVIDFEDENSKPNGIVQISQVQVTAIGWDARETVSPEESARKLVDSMKVWLDQSDFGFISEIAS